ncbi:MAG: neutral zinc metallopeptidase [Deinococcales bacterium]
MNWRNFRKSGNVEDRRGGGVARAGGLGLGGIVIAVIASLVFGVNPAQVIGLLGGATGGRVSSTGNVNLNDRDRQFAESILGKTEEVWGNLFKQAGQNYQPARLVLFSGQDQSGCGVADAAMGPFYCPLDQTIYIDMSFFQELRGTSNSDFAQAYVLAHEVGHHVQQLLGISDQVRAQRARSDKVTSNALSVRQELQADCFAGIWGYAVAKDRTANLTESEIRAALETAAEIGDDVLQRQAGRTVNPHTFTHGSASQRQQWFVRGLQSGQVGDCDTFKSRI